MREVFLGTKYALLSMFREKQMLFWIVIFPIILLSVFSVIFSNLDKPENLQVKLGVYEHNKLENILENIEIVELVKGDRKSLENMLENDEIDAFLDENYELVVTKSEMKQNIMLNILESIKKYSIAYIIKLKDGYSSILLSEEDIMNFSLKDIATYIGKIDKYMDTVSDDFDMKSIVKKIEHKDQQTGAVFIVIFSSFAMFSFYGGYISLHYCYYIQGYHSDIGMRIAVSPYKKIYLVLVSFIVTVLGSVILDTLLLLYTKYVLGVELFSNIGITYIVFIVASICSFSLGTFIGVLKTFSNEQKTAIYTFTLLVFAFLSGMGGSVSVKLKIEESFPIFNKINPVNLVNELFYQVNLIGDMSNVVVKIVNLLIISLLFAAISTIFLRRKTYDSL